MSIYQDEFVILNSAGVCFGAKDDQFGSFEVEVGGSIDAVKLVHLTGLVNSGGGIDKSTKWGFDPDFSEIVFSDFPNPLHLFSGQELRLWHLDDLRNYYEGYDGGNSCANVFAKYL